MQDDRKTKAQLIAELAALRSRVAALEASSRASEAAPLQEHASELRFRRLIENAWEVVVLVSQEGEITFASQAAVRVLGHSVDEYMGRNVFDLLHRDDIPKVREAFEQLIRDPSRTTTVAARACHKDGSWRWLEVVATPLLHDPSVGAIVANYRDVTEHVNALRALRESETRLRTVISSAPLVLFAIDSKGTFTLSEGRGLAALGLKPGQVVGQSVFEVYKGVPRMLDMIRQALRGESLHRTVDVEELSWDVRYIPVRDESGNVDGVIGVATDITVHRRMEEALSVERAYLDELFESSPEAVVLVDNENRILRLNREFTTLFGYTVDDALGQSVDMLLAPESLHDEAVQITNQVASGDRVAVETVRKTRDGTLVYVSILGAPITTIGGQVAVYGIYRDISQRKRAEEALRRSEANYRGLVENATHGIYRSSPDGRFLMVNPALVTMLGYKTADELMSVDIGRDVYLHPEDRQQAVERYRLMGRYDAMEVDWKRKDGTPIAVWLSGRPVKDGAGNVQYYEMIAEDVTERRMLEDQLRQVQKMEAIGQLTGGIAHDFNNLLTVISANAEIVAESLPEDLAELRGDVEDLLTAAQRGTALVKKLLGFGRRAMLDLHLVDVATLVADTAAMVRRIVPENIEIDLVPSGPVSSVRVDPVAMEQILLNLATNSRDAMPDGGTLRFELADERVDEDFSMSHPGLAPGRYVCVTVSDTGIGMSTDTKEHIFEPFFTKKPHGLGTGLGMAMVYGLVKQLSGYVDVVSEPHVGTAVRLYFPVYETLAPAETVHGDSEEAVGGHETILVVEDEEAIRRTIKRALEGQGYTVLLAANGEAALQILQERDYGVDLVVSDLIMPKLGGRQLYEALEQDGNHIRFLFTSGYSTTEVGRSGSLSSSVPLLLKPWTLGDLFTRVREVLDKA